MSTVKINCQKNFKIEKRNFWLFHITFQYMRCFAERSGVKYGRAKCNERTAYTVLGEPNGAIAE